MNPESASFESGCADEVAGDDCPAGEAGEIPFGVCDAEINGESVSRRWALSGMAVSEARRTNFPGPTPCFCLNFSSQEDVIIFNAFSWPAQKTFALSSIWESVMICPFFCIPFTQTARARSISGGDFPLLL